MSSSSVNSLFSCSLQGRLQGTICLHRTLSSPAASSLTPTNYSPQKSPLYILSSRPPACQFQHQYSSTDIFSVSSGRFQKEGQHFNPCFLHLCLLLFLQCQSVSLHQTTPSSASFLSFLLIFYNNSSHFSLPHSILLAISPLWYAFDRWYLEILLLLCRYSFRKNLSLKCYVAILMIRNKFTKKEYLIFLFNKKWNFLNPLVQ